MDTYSTDIGNGGVSYTIGKRKFDPSDDASLAE
jgi:hypothetical protein